MSELSDMNELTEKMEHAGHSGHGKHGKLGMYVGVTIACLGVLMALCSALVGGQRTEQIATMIEQSSTGTKYQALSTKYRVLVAQLQQLHSLTPDADKFKKWDDESRSLTAEITNPDIIRLARIIRLENAKNLNAEIPTQADLKHFATVIKNLEKENAAAREWTESYEAAILTHATAGEHFEWAQLSAEIGIVLASIALLFMNRLVWFGSIALGLTTILIATTTYLTTSTQLQTTDAKIEEAKQNFHTFNGDTAGKLADDSLLKSVDEVPTPDIDPT